MSDAGPPIRCAQRRSRRWRLALSGLLAALAAGCGAPNPSQSLASARDSFANADYRTAAIYAHNAVQADSSNVAARLLLGRIEIELGEVTAARADLERASKMGAAVEELAVPLASAYVRTDDAQKALALLDQVAPQSRRADYWLASAEAYLGTRRYDKSLEALSEAEKAGAQPPSLLLGRARVARAQGNEDAALKLVDNALALDPSDADALVFRGGMNNSAGKSGAAERDLQRAADIYVKQGRPALAAPALLQLVQLQVASNALEPAAATAKQLSDLYPGASFGDYAKALIAYRQGRFDDAIQLLRVALSRMPGQPQFTMLLGTAHLAAGNLGQAEQRFLAVLKQNPSDPAAIRLLAETRLRQQRPKAALEALQSYPDGAGRTGIALLRARAEVADHDLQAARATLRAAADAMPSAVDVRAALGNVEIQMGDSAEAMRIAKSLQAQFGRRPDGFTLEGHIMMADHRYADAAELYKQAYSLQPSWPLLADAARALNLSKDNEWEVLIDAWLKAAPQDVRARLLAADLLQGSGRLSAALDAYEQVIALDKRNVVALNNAAGLAQRLSKDGALNYAQRAAELEPNSASVLDTLGWILTQRSRAGDGLKYLERATQLSPEVQEIRYHLAVAQVQLGRTAAARGTLESVLADKQAFEQRDAAQKLLESL